MQQRTTTAKSVGQVAVGVRGPDGAPARRARGGQLRASAAQSFLGRDRQRDGRTARPARSAPAPTPAPRTAHRRAARRPPTGATTARRRPATTLPIPGYDALSASQVVERLAGLSAGELDAVHAYESGPPQPPDDSRQDRPDLRVGRTWRTRGSRRTPTSRALADLARDAAGASCASERGGALWSVREARPEPLEAAFAALLERDDATVLVGTLDDRVVGYGIVQVEQLRDGSRLGVIDEIYVEPEARAVGVGEVLVERLVAFCTRRRLHRRRRGRAPG